VTGIYIRFHRWCGFSLFNAEQDLFHHVVKVGFVTVYIEKASLLAAYRKLRTAIAERVRRDQEGR
jgi:hypothetical protein